MKIALLIFVIANLVSVTVLILVKDRLKSEILILNGEKLKGIAATIATTVNGNEFKKLNFFDPPSVKENEVFNKLRKELIKFKQAVGFREDIYTLSLLDSTKAIFGIMTNYHPFPGDTLHLVSDVEKDALFNVYNTKKAIYTDLFEDQYGKWLSGLAPIIDSTNNVVGVVQVDHESSFIYAYINNTNSYLIYFGIILIPVTIILSIIVSKLISKPISRVTGIIENISHGDYTADGKKIKTSGEIKQLVDATDIMRKTILEQRQKIHASISKLRKFNEELKQAKEKAESSDRLKTEFLSIISHEIRTPINAILGNIYLIKEELINNLTEDIITNFDEIDIGSKRLIRTVDLIIILSELQTGNYQKNEREIDPVGLLNDLIKEYNELIRYKKLNASLHQDQDEYTIRSDEYIVKQIFSNLLDNAVKYTENGTIEINFTRNEDKNICVTFKDTGVGISKDFLPNMFDPFSQEEKGYTRRFEGNGLGLALVKLGCDLYNIDILVESEKYKGSSFTLVFSNTPVNSNKTLAKTA